jgi:ligand-binding sensor domain-containing protein
VIRGRRLPAILALAALLACTQKGVTDPAAMPAAAPAPAPAPPVHVVAEHFEVGAFAYVRSLVLKGDDLYVGTSTGVLRVNRRTGDVARTWSVRDGMRNAYAFVVREAPDGALWMGTNGGGLSVFSGGAVHNYMPKDGLADLWVYDVAFPPDGDVWLATWDGINRIHGSRDDPKSWTTYNVQDGLANRWVYAAKVGPDGALWFGTEGGLSRLKEGAWTTWRHADGLGGPNPRGLKASGRPGFGALHPGEHSHDLTTLDTSGAETYNEDYVFSLLVDRRDGALWVGTWGGGVARFDGRKFENHTADEGLAGNVVYSIAQGPDGALWFGTNHGLSRYDGTRWINYAKADGLKGDDVYAVAVDPDHMVWVGQKGAVTRLAPRTAAAPAPGPA